MLGKRSFSTFVLLSLGIILCYTVCGLCAEKLFKELDANQHSWLFTVFIFLHYVFFSFLQIELKSNRKHICKIPFYYYILLGTMCGLMIGLSHRALNYLNYPTYQMFKCCKLLPVMLGGFLIQKKRYNIWIFFSAILISIGLIFFTLTDKVMNPDFNIFGIIYLTTYLICDAINSNVQELLMKKFHIVKDELILFPYLVGALLLTCISLYNCDFLATIQFIYDHQYPYQLFICIILYALTGFFGLKLVLIMLDTFGVLTTTTVTIFRKALNIILSFIFFSNKASLNNWKLIWLNKKHS
ncbi:hypothetical protein SNEBB_003002 [Seison nebaliae]|nr:hypothetical protein SNEBB_003002 [Seison nebaliae]